ncbi:unnamed protein product [Moneuplotes crassus]|uniref:EF-hand domain-containing protein n=2 Tax=Euplotes crassus TaxID=5936 RepID=A0AAD2D795_EUPCR|nr:unnamed protein product [Moneuplotes crassus]
MDKEALDKNGLNEKEVQELLKATSEKSMNKIIHETEMLKSQAQVNDMNIDLKEVENFLQEISPGQRTTIEKSDLKRYLEKFPKKYSPKEINFLMNGQKEMDAKTLHELLTTTSIEPFDPIEEAFKLLDVEGKGFLTVDTFKTIFSNLGFGEITPSDEDIFKEVADFDGDGVINLEDFKKILVSYQAPEEEVKE